MKTKRMFAGAAVAVLAVMSTVACNAATDTDPTPVKQFKITPAAGVKTAVASATPASQATAATTPQGTASAGGTVEIKASGSTLKFDKEKLSAAAGTVTIAFDNQDSGIPHNISVHEGADAKGKTLGKTDLETGPVTQELKLDLKAGSYYYQCDVHPTTMKGTLTVS